MTIIEVKVTRAERRSGSPGPFLRHTSPPGVRSRRYGPGLPDRRSVDQCRWR